MEIQEHNTPKKRAGKYYLVSFFAGAAVMAVEVTATRLLTPHFGGTLFIWTSTIAVILTALSVGYFLGSRWAKKENTEKILSRALLWSAFLTMIIPFAVHVVTFLFLGSVVDVLYYAPVQFAIILGVALLVLTPAAVTYGLFSPLIIEALGRNGHHPGEVAGKIFAISTIGSIVGTISATVFFIPFVGTHLTFILMALIMAIFGMFFFQRKPVWLLILFVLMFTLGFGWRPNQLDVDNLVFQDETLYQSVRLLDDGDHYSLIFNEGLGIQSIQPKETAYTGRYWDWLTLLPFIRDREDQRALIVGYAGGTIARLWDETPASELIGEVDAVEIDGAVVDLVRSYFSEDDFGTNMFIQDGRQYLATTEEQYDFMQIDAFSNELQIPFQFTTLEFMNLAKSKLKEDGIFTMNIALGVEGSTLLNGILNTTAAIFGNVYTLAQVDGVNVMVLASDSEIDLTAVPEWSQRAGIPNPGFISDIVTFDKTRIVFTDDKAPIEWLSEEALLSFF